MANKVILNGNLGRDAEINEGLTRAVLSVGTSEYYKGEEHTEWHRVVCFNNLVKSCLNLKKGRKVYIEAKLKYRTVEAEGQETKYYTDIVGDKIEF